MDIEEQFIEEEFLLEEEEIEDIYQYHGAEYDEFSLIEFKDHEEENYSDYRGQQMSENLSNLTIRRKRI